MLPVLKKDLFFISIYENGKFYMPAWKHYGINITNVQCDMCGKSNLTSCVGFAESDLCMGCVDKIANKSVIQFNKPPQPITKMMPSMFKPITPITTRMEQSIFKQPTPMYPVTNMETSNLKTTKVSSFIDTPKVSSFADTPKVSRFADTPKVSRFADTPKVSRFADTPKVSSFADTPKVSSFADTPKVSSFADTPKVSSFADIPKKCDTKSDIVTFMVPNLFNIYIDKGYRPGNNNIDEMKSVTYMMPHSLSAPTKIVDLPSSFQINKNNNEDEEDATMMMTSMFD